MWVPKLPTAYFALSVRCLQLLLCLLLQTDYVFVALKPCNNMRIIMRKCCNPPSDGMETNSLTPPLAYPYTIMSNRIIYSEKNNNNITVPTYTLMYDTRERRSLYNSHILFHTIFKCYNCCSNL